MNTLELMVEKVLTDNNYIAVPSLVSAAAEYIDKVNENKLPSDNIYTPEQWLKDTKVNYPESLVKRFHGYTAICDYLVEQRKLCIDQTGCSFCITDLVGHFDAPDFQEEFGAYKITLNDILNFLLVYYEKHEKGDRIRETDFI